MVDGEHTHGSFFEQSPKAGTLPPVDDPDGGLKFVVYCTPRSYGKMQRCRLLIKTAEYQWAYEIVGVPEKATMPS